MPKSRGTPGRAPGRAAGARDGAEPAQATTQGSSTPAASDRTSGTEPLVRTGIAGLDDVLGGGLPRERLYLVEGTPGTGKTTLSLQFLLEGRSRGEQGLYVTLSETADELHGVARSHGWSLDELALLDMTAVPVVASPESQYTVFHPSEVELQDTVDAVLARVEAARPTRVVLDSLSEMRLLARDRLRFRRQILALKQFFAARGATVLLLDDQTTGDSDMQLHSLAHGVIRLEQMALAHGSERRQLRVTKLRGVNFHGGYHDYALRTGGMEVFPRIRLGAPPPPLVHDGVIPAASAELNALLGGGIPHGSSVLITGAPGTGKSVLSTQYAVAAAARGERVAIYLFDERVGTFLQRAKALGTDVQPHVDAGRIRLTPLEPTEISPGELTNRVLHAVEHDGVRLLLVDSLNGLTQAMLEERHLTVKIHELLGYLGSRGVTTLLTLAQRGIFGSPNDEAADISYLADVVILLRYFEALGEVRRAISIVKQRSGGHEKTIREFRIGHGGVDVGEPLREFQGVLTGVPTFTGRPRELMNGER